MKTSLIVQRAAALVLTAVLASCAPSSVTTRVEGPAPDPLMGDWAGNRVSNDGVVAPLAVQVIALGGGTYRFVVQPSFDQKQDAQTMVTEGRLDGDRIVPLTESIWTMRLENGELRGETSRGDAVHFTLRRIVRLSPNLG
ncbi:MAG TPA: hypothetical protein VK569_05455, partial [Bacteroidota bacterium]|nr:hypothetical protein [Bacteroidota bacterium]